MKLTLKNVIKNKKVMYALFFLSVLSLLLHLFNNNNISLEWFDYSGYNEYYQLWGEFIPQVSILDLLFNHGKNSKKFMKFV